ncbi:MAG: hypothetical protein LIP77_00180, partial [Planctomycetes bacterium]|nr:hypothetical protein [Planctomycetota bacterium]
MKSGTMTRCFRWGLVGLGAVVLGCGGWFAESVQAAEAELIVNEGPPYEDDMADVIDEANQAAQGSTDGEYSTDIEITINQDVLLNAPSTSSGSLYFLHGSSDSVNHSIGTGTGDGFRNLTITGGTDEQTT